ncbi:hypothetical protein SMICM17S_11565 [Streptomyces microflavus]
MSELPHGTGDGNGHGNERGLSAETGLSYAHGTGDTALLGDTIGRNLDRAIAAHGDREALVDVVSGRRWTYTELGADIDELARALMASGVEKGDRVGIWASTPRAACLRPPHQRLPRPRRPGPRRLPVPACRPLHRRPVLVRADRRRPGRHLRTTGRA